MLTRDSKYDILFEPARIGRKTMKNRFYQAPQRCRLEFAFVGFRGNGRGGNCRHLTACPLSGRKVRACAAVLATDAEGRVLLAKRADDGSWGPPGGGVAPGERWAGAARSDCPEETGLELELGELFGVYGDPGAQTWRYASGMAVLFFGVASRARASPGIGRADGEASEVGFLIPDDLPRPLFPPGVRALGHARREAGAVERGVRPYQPVVHIGSNAEVHLRSVVRPATVADGGWAREVVVERRGSAEMVSRRRSHAADELPAPVAEENGERCGLATYRTDGAETELLTLDAFHRAGVSGAPC
jgi:8-oxo-dGTP diphosphatase